MGVGTGKRGTYRPVGREIVIHDSPDFINPKTKEKFTMMSLERDNFWPRWDWKWPSSGSQTEVRPMPNGGAELAISTIQRWWISILTAMWWLTCRGFNNWWMRLVGSPSTIRGFPISIADQEEFNKISIGVGEQTFEWGGSPGVFTDALPRPWRRLWSSKTSTEVIQKNRWESFEPKQCEPIKASSKHWATICRPTNLSAKVFHRIARLSDSFQE